MTVWVRQQRPNHVEHLPFDLEVARPTAIHQGVVKLCPYKQTDRLSAVAAI